MTEIKKLSELRPEAGTELTDAVFLEWERAQRAAESDDDDEHALAIQDISGIPPGESQRERFDSWHRAQVRSHGREIVEYDNGFIGVPVARPADRIGGRIDWATFWSAEPEASDFLVEPVVVAGRGHALYSPAKQGKSYLAIYMAACLATGRDAFVENGTQPTDVLYLDYEMMTDDLRDYLEQNGFGPDDDMSRLHYFQLPTLRPLDTADGAAELLELVDDTAARLVIIDTMSRVLQGEENAADTIRAFYRLTGAELKRRGVAYIRLDHTGKDASKGQRGSSAKVDDVDLVWSVRRAENDGLALKATHRRMLWVPHTVNLSRADVGFRLAADSWPKGTEALARTLAELGVPVEAGQRIARRALSEAGQRASNEVLAAALRWRKSSYGNASWLDGSD